MMRRLRIAAVGVGSMAEARTAGHLGVIAALEDHYELCALVDLDRKRLREAGEHFGVEALYTDLDEMLRNERPDVVYRLTPTDSVYPVCVKAAEAGAHVISEIPIAITLEMADAIMAACRRNNVKLEIAENVWLWPEEQLKQKIVRQSLLGKITFARLKYPCGAYHGFNAIRMIIGKEPTRVLGYAGRAEVVPQRAYGGDPMTWSWWESAVIEFPDGTGCIYEMPPKGRKWRRNWDIEGTRGQIYGDTLILLDYRKAGDDPEFFAGEVEYPIERLYAEARGKQLLSAVRVNTDPPVVWENPYLRYGIGHGDDIAKAAILESMYRAVTEGIEPRYGAANARRDYEIWIAIRESALRGNVWVELPLKEKTALEREMEAAFVRRYGMEMLSDPDRLIRLRYTRASVIWDVAGWL